MTRGVPGGGGGDGGGASSVLGLGSELGSSILSSVGMACRPGWGRCGGSRRCGGRRRLLVRRWPAPARTWSGLG
eukprot:scaffold105500_cov60-Phaeocystis_antarctica.AAC.4